MTVTPRDEFINSYPFIVMSHLVLVILNVGRELSVEGRGLPDKVRNNQRCLVNLRLTTPDMKL